ncbi:LAFA_0G08900g1_1 [Lachancea sp. 'fantastica']|nr:LAFA_0G08900g1_1 [Lachancea sp. 'fantastica']
MKDLGALTSIDEFPKVKALADIIEKEREGLALQLQTRTGQNEAVLHELDQVDQKLLELAKEISSVRSNADVAQIRTRYGSLAILDQIDALFAQKAAKTAELSALKRLDEISSGIKAVATESKVEEAQLQQWHDNLDGLKNQVRNSDLEPVFQSFNQLLLEQALPLREELKSRLLDSGWDLADKDINAVVSESSASSLKELSSRIYRLNKMWQPQQDSDEIWNFECIANNFRIKFVYHFVNESIQKPHSVEMYFKFLEKYLDLNLYKCVYLFRDPNVPNLDEAYVHQQFINHVLAPIREKVNTTLVNIANSASSDHLKTLVVLISQIFIIDNALVKKHFYDGLGLIAMIPEEVLTTWLSFEIDSSLNQFQKIIKTTNVAKSGSDFAKLLENLYLYFEPFFNLEHGNLMEYKLRTTKTIFMDLTQKYRDILLNSKDETSGAISEQAQFEKTLWKTRNLQLIRATLESFADKLNFILLTEYLNAATSSSYDTIFDDILNLYENAISAAKESIIHRYKKLMNVAFRNYFKVSDWNQITSVPQQCSAELVSPLNLSNKLITMMETVDLTPDMLLDIKGEILNILIHYMVDYVINLNRFNKFGLDQLHLDFGMLKESLRFSQKCDPQSAEEGSFLETLKVLALKYEVDDSCQHFLAKSFIDRRQFSDLRERLSIKYATDSELANALYRNL